MTARTACRILLAVAAGVFGIGVTAEPAAAQRWEGHPFVFVLMTDDGTKCNLDWADVARTMDFRFTIAVNQSQGDNSRRLSGEELSQLYADGFEIANHSYSHGQETVPLTCPEPPRGSLLAYFDCAELDPAVAASLFHREIDRAQLADFAGMPLEAVRTFAYPRHLHSQAAIDSLVAAGYIGARFGDNENYFVFGNGDFSAPAHNSWDGGISLFRVPLAAYTSELVGNHSAVPPVQYTHEQFAVATQPLIDQAIVDGGIFAIYAHHFGDADDSRGDINYGTGGLTPTDLQWIVNLVRDNGGAVMTFGDAVAYYRARSRMSEIDGDLVWQAVVSNVTVDASAVTGITAAAPCALAIPVVINHPDATPIRGYSVTFALDPALALCATPSGSIRQGDYLNGYGFGTQFYVTDHADGSYTVDGVILGSPCGPAANAGTLFTIDLTRAVAEGVGTVTVTDVDLRDCGGAPLSVEAGRDAVIAVDTVVPEPVTRLAARPLAPGPEPGNTLALDLTWTPSASPDVARVLVYRKGFGGYPEYDDAGGREPALDPAATPAAAEAAGWDLAAAATASGVADLSDRRDVWSYVAYAEDELGNVSPPSTLSAGVPNYLLGDVSDGLPPPGETMPGDGDNRVDGLDISLLGAHYGLRLAPGQAANRLDIGPIAGDPLLGRPLTDDRIDFEDLVLLAINFGSTALAVAQQPEGAAPSPHAGNSLALEVGGPATEPGTLAAQLALTADGRIRGLSVALSWNAAAVEPAAVRGGGLLTEQDGTCLTLSPRPGTVDIAYFGAAGRGIAGAGVVAEIIFRIVGPGDPAIALREIRARSAVNEDLAVAGSTGATPQALPALTRLHAAAPNPFNPATTLAYDLAVPGRVTLRIYGIDGRLLRTLVDAIQPTGRQSAVWNGRDDAGRPVAAGTYVVKLQGPDRSESRCVMLVK